MFPVPHVSEETIRRVVREELDRIRLEATAS
jgi:hypothetical protein